MKPQNAAVLRLLRRSPQGVTALDALLDEDVRCNRLAARIEELRKAGYSIDTEWRTSQHHKRFALYRLHEAPVQLTLDAA
jgi:hypothetical protein